MSVWNDINHISKLKVTNLGGADNSVIYANNLHQVAVEVFLEPRNSKNELMSISSDEIIKHVKLVDYNNNPLSSKFMVTAHHGPYVTPVTSSVGAFSSAANTAVLYVSLSPGYASKNIKMAVQCTLNNEQYTTAENNNNNLASPSVFTLNILNSRVFNQSDLKVSSYKFQPTNHEYTFYYVTIKDAAKMIVASGPSNHDKFDFKSSGGWRGECFSMGRNTEVLNNSKFWHPLGNRYLNIHEHAGVCFLSARTWGQHVLHHNDPGSAKFQMYDQYGNLLSFRATPDENCFINFTVF